MFIVWQVRNKVLKLLQWQSMMILSFTVGKSQIHLGINTDLRVDPNSILYLVSRQGKVRIRRSYGEQNHEEKTRHWMSSYKQITKCKLFQIDSGNNGSGYCWSQT